MHQLTHECTPYPSSVQLPSDKPCPWSLKHETETTVYALARFTRQAFGLSRINSSSNQTLKTCRRFLRQLRRLLHMLPGGSGGINCLIQRRQ